MSVELVHDPAREIAHPAREIAHPSPRNRAPKQGVETLKPGHRGGDIPKPLCRLEEESSPTHTKAVINPSLCAAPSGWR